MSKHRLVARGNPAQNPALRPTRTAAKPTNDLNSPTTGRSERAYAALLTALASKGFSLMRTDPKDGEVVFWIERFGAARPFTSLDSVRRFLNGPEDLA